MNSFLVQQLGSQIYTMPGMTTYLHLMADKPGEFPGISANFSGNGFAWVHFIVKAAPSAEFESWVEPTRGSGSALDAVSYTELAKPSQGVPPMTYRMVDPKLFQRIIDKRQPLFARDDRAKLTMPGAKAVAPSERAHVRFALDRKRDAHGIEPGR